MAKISATLLGEKISSNSEQAIKLFSNQRFGEKLDEKIYYSLPEALFLVELKKMDIYDYKNKFKDEDALKLMIRFCIKEYEEERIKQNDVTIPDSESNDDTSR